MMPYRMREERFLNLKSFCKIFSMAIRQIERAMRGSMIAGEIGMNMGQLFLSLLSFNIGVEIAQIGIIILMFAVVYIPSQKTWYRQIIQIPISLAISMIGLYWFIERVFF
jgi:hypothetical protein